MFHAITRQLFKERVNGRIIPVGGMLENPKDHRDFAYGDLGGWFDYKPKQDVFMIPTLGVKDQNPLNNCVFQSYTLTREVDEGVPLSVRSLTRYADSKGLIHGDGFSNLRSAQQAGMDFGIAEASLCPDIAAGWATYASGSNSAQVIESAAKHKDKSFFRVLGESQIVKALDEGHLIHTGFTWRSAYNMSGGFRSPWVVKWGAGVAVGGHAVAIKGYDLKKRLYRIQNSFGKDWGDGGDFYVPMDALGWTEGYVSIDLDADTVAALIEKFNGKDVKTQDSSTIYRIENGTKRAYLTEDSFLKNGGSFTNPTFTVVSGTLLSQAPNGNSMP